MIEGIIKFSGFRVEKISYNFKAMDSEISTEKASISPEFMLRLVHKATESEQDTKKFFNILFGVRVGFNEDENIPFSSEVVLRGFYRFSSEDAEGYEITDMNKFLLTNGCAILFPYLRAALTDVTSKSNHNPIILPTINFHKFIENRDIDELLLDSSRYVEKI